MLESRKKVKKSSRRRKKAKKVRSLSPRRRPSSWLVVSTARILRSDSHRPLRLQRERRHPRSQRSNTRLSGSTSAGTTL